MLAPLIRNAAEVGVSFLIGKLAGRGQANVPGRQYEFEDYVGVIRRAREIGVPPAALSMFLDAVATRINSAPTEGTERRPEGEQQQKTPYIV